MTEEFKQVELDDNDHGEDTCSCSDSGQTGEELEVRLGLSEKAAEDYRAQLLRCQADFKNFRRRLERERVEQIKYANEKLLQNLIPVVDNLQRAIEAGKDKGSSFEGIMEGIGQVYKQFLIVLEKEGVVPLDPGIGNPFDPEQQEALYRDEGLAEVVVEELLTGWRYLDRVLRPTLVKVGPKTVKQNNVSGDESTAEKSDTYKAGAVQTADIKEVEKDNG